MVAIVAPNQTLSEWRLIHWIICIVFVVTNLVFIIFGSGELQDWNDPSFERKTKKETPKQSKEAEELLMLEKI